jgi:hypothetical protein
MSRPWAVDDGRRTTDSPEIWRKKKTHLNINASTLGLHRPSYPRKSSTSGTAAVPSESLHARSRREPPPPPPRPSLSVAPPGSATMLLRTAAAPVDVCVVLIGAVPIYL